jgi:putative membrane protein
MGVHMHWFQYGHMIWMTLSWIVAFVVIVALLWIVASAVRGSPESPETILRRRYAAGEIDKEEFERKSAELRDTRNAG